MTDIVSATVYVTSLDDVANMNKVYIALMPDPKPASDRAGRRPDRRGQDRNVGHRSKTLKRRAVATEDPKRLKHQP